MTLIKLWRNNRTDSEWSIPLDDVASKFIEYDNRHGNSEYWPLERCIRAFLTDHETEGGLQSVFDENDYEMIHEACRILRWPKTTTKENNDE